MIDAKCLLMIKHTDVEVGSREAFERDEDDDFFMGI